VYAQAQVLKPQFLSEEWLYKKGRQRPGREVKIASGVNVVHRLHKSPGGLLRATIEARENCLNKVSLSGDFFCYPEDAVSQMELALEGVSLEQVQGIVADFYARGRVETPGVTADDWLKVLLG
jgi:hypothetical protein